MCKEKIKLLLVEDDLLIAKSMKHNLEELSYEVEISKNGINAIHHVVMNNSECDLILMDINLGQGIDGFQTATEINKHKEIPIIFLSSNVEIKSDETTNQIKSYGYVLKQSGISILDFNIKTALRLFAEKSQTVEILKSLNVITDIYEVYTSIATSYLENSNLKIDDKINESLELIGTFIGADRVYIFDYDFKNRLSSNAYEWCAEGVQPEILNLQDIPMESHLYLLETHEQGLPLIIENVDEMEDDDPVKALLAPQMIKSLITMPVFHSSNCIGFIGLHYTKNHKKLSLKEQALLENFSRLLAGLYSRDQHELSHENNLVSNFEFIFKNDNSSYFSHISNSFEKIFSVKINLNDPNWCKSVRFHPEDFKDLNSRLEHSEANESNFNFVCRLIVGDNVLEVEISASVVIKNTDVLLKGVMKNLTSRKNNEDELRNKTIFNDLVLNNIPADIALFDKNHDYLFINKNGIKDDGIRDWLIGKNDFDYYDFKGLDTNLAQIRRDNFNKAIETKQEVDWIDKIEKEGKVVYTLRRFFPFFIDGIFEYMIGYGIDVTELKTAQNKIYEKNTMLQEIHHRVANNNAIISSILSLQIQSSNSNEIQLVLKNVLARIMGINELYTNLLYSNEKLIVRIDKYFEGLISSFKSAFDVKSKFEIHMSVDRIEVLSSKAVTIGIIVNELLTNVYKYAYKENEKGIVSLSIVKKEENVCLIVSDDGRGIENKKLDKSNFGFGLTTIKMLAEEQLDGVLNIYNSNGMHVEISFSLN